MNKKIYTLKLVKGFILSNFAALIIIGLTSYFIPASPGTLVSSEFVIVPVLMGIISAWCWKDLEFKNKKLIILSCINGLLAISLSAIFLGEGIICLIIVSPLIFGFIITGAFIGKGMFKKDNQKLNLSILALLFIVFIADALSEHHYENLVSDEIVINAPLDEVWKNVVSFEKIKAEDKYWLFKIGMPSPVAATVDGHFEGAGRKCIFSNGYIFDEKMVSYKPGKDLTFDIISQPRDPEIMGHIDILRGQFLLKSNGNGTTTLTGNSWYRLYIFPVWYYDLWAKSITRNVHRRVMDHIKLLSEKR